KYTLDDSFIRVNVDALTRCNLMIRSAIATDVDISVLSNVINKPGDLVGVSLDHNFVIRLRIDNSNDRSISIDRVVLDIRPDVIEPYFLSGRFKACRRCIVQVLE